MNHQALNVLGFEYKAEPKGPPPLPIKYKSLPPQKTAIIGPFTDVETRKKYTEVITAQLLMQVPDPMLRDFQFDRLSKVEQAKYLEEARRIEEEQIAMASVLSQGEHQREQCSGSAENVG